MPEQCESLCLVTRRRMVESSQSVVAQCRVLTFDICTDRVQREWSVRLNPSDKGGFGMSDYGVAVTWGDPKTGREKTALDCLTEATTNNDKAVANGKIASWDLVIFEPSGMPPAGVIRIYGTQDQVEDYIRSDDFQEPIEKANLTVNNVGYRRFVTGAALTEGIGRYAGLIDSL